MLFRPEVVRPERAVPSVDEYAVVPVPLWGVVAVEEVLHQDLAVVHHAELQPAEGLVSYGLVLEQFVEGVGEVAGSVHSFACEPLELIEEPLLGADPPAPSLGEPQQASNPWLLGYLLDPGLGLWVESFLIRTKVKFEARPDLAPPQHVFASPFIFCIVLVAHALAPSLVVCVVETTRSSASEVVCVQRRFDTSVRPSQVRGLHPWLQGLRRPSVAPCGLISP